MSTRGARESYRGNENNTFYDIWGGFVFGTGKPTDRALLVAAV